MSYKSCGPQAGSNFLLAVSPSSVLMQPYRFPHIMEGISWSQKRNSQFPNHLPSNGWELEDMSRCQSPREHRPLSPGSSGGCCCNDLRHDLVLGEHLQSSGCLGIGHGKVQEKPWLLKTIPESHWNALPEYTEPERSWVLYYFIHFYFLAGLFSWKFRTLKLSQAIRSKHAMRLPCG